MSASSLHRESTDSLIVMNCLLANIGLGDTYINRVVIGEH